MSHFSGLVVLTAKTGNEDVLCQLSVVDTYLTPAMPVTFKGNYHELDTKVIKSLQFCFCVLEIRCLISSISDELFTTINPDTF